MDSDSFRFQRDSGISFKIEIRNAKNIHKRNGKHSTHTNAHTEEVKSEH